MKFRCSTLFCCVPLVLCYGPTKQSGRTMPSGSRSQHTNFVLYHFAPLVRRRSAPLSPTLYPSVSLCTPLYHFITLFSTLHHSFRLRTNQASRANVSAGQGQQSLTYNFSTVALCKVLHLSWKTLNQSVQLCTTLHHMQFWFALYFSVPLCTVPFCTTLCTTQNHFG